MKKKHHCARSFIFHHSGHSEFIYYMNGILLYIPCLSRNTGDRPNSYETCLQLKSYGCKRTQNILLTAFSLSYFYQVTTDRKFNQPKLIMIKRSVFSYTAILSFHPRLIPIPQNFWKQLKCPHMSIEQFSL